MFAINEQFFYLPWDCLPIKIEVVRLFPTILRLYLCSFTRVLPIEDDVYIGTLAKPKEALQHTERRHTWSLGLVWFVLFNDTWCQ